MKNSSGRAIRGPRKGKERRIPPPLDPWNLPPLISRPIPRFPSFLPSSLPLFPSRPNFVRHLEEDRNVKSWPERGGNERFTSEIRMARRKSISGASMIVLLIPRATLSTRENCKLPVYDISYGVRMYVCRWIRARGGHEKKGGWEGRGRGWEKRIEIITPGTNRNFVLSVLTQSMRSPLSYITEKNTSEFRREGETEREREFSRMDFGRTCIARGRHVRPRY